MYGEMRYTERMKPYSQDLRERVLGAVKETKLSQAEIGHGSLLNRNTFTIWGLVRLVG